VEFGLKDKVALITGTGSQVGMGKAVALTLAKEGCHIISSDIDLAGAEKTAEEVRALKRQAVAFRVDISDRDQINKMVKEALKIFGKIDIFVGVAGASAFSGPLADAKQEALDKDVNLNLMGTINCTKAVLPSMMEHKYGKIVLLSSLAGLLGAPGATAYSAAKAGIMGFTRALAREAGLSGINVNNIAPGVVMTNFYGGEGAPLLPPQLRNTADNCTGKAVTTQDIANMVAFLVSDVSLNITGQCLVIDGGIVMN
jgi:NAD(P)-dependent dehydrogenase (short-subunit alcohol dehydrogenase family)